MKFSKIAITVTLLFVFFINFTPKPKSFEGSFIEVYFSNKLDITDLSKIKLDLLEKEIKLNYDYLKFNTDGKLTEIEYHLIAGKFGGSDKTDNTNNEIGFIINTDPNPEYGIIVGLKESIQKRRVVLENPN